MQFAPGRDQAKAILAVFENSQFVERLFESHGRAATLQPPEQGREHVGRPIAGWKDLAGRLDLCLQSLGGKQGQRVVDAERGQGGMQESARRPVSRNDPLVVGGLGDVAACAAGHQDLHAGPAIFLQQQRLAATLGGPHRGNEPRRAGPHHDDFPE